MVKYKEQTVDDLQFHLVKGDLDTSQLQLLTTKMKQFSLGCIEASIIGASHSITLKMPDGEILHEVLACCDVTVEEGRIAHFGSLDEILASDMRFELFGSLEYKVLSEVVDFATAADRIASTKAAFSDKPNIALQYDFPGEGGYPPSQTYIKVYQNGDALEWQTIHTYSNDGKVVFSHTTITQKQGGRA